MRKVARHSFKVKNEADQHEPPHSPTRPNFRTSRSYRSLARFPLTRHRASDKQSEAQTAKKGVSEHYGENYGAIEPPLLLQANVN